MQHYFAKRNGKVVKLEIVGGFPEKQVDRCGEGSKMTYKEEKNKSLNFAIKKKIDETFPKFIAGYFMTLNSPETKRGNIPHIKSALEYLVSEKIVNRENTKDITPNDLQEVKYTDIIGYLDGLSMAKSSICTRKAVLGSFWQYLQNNGYTSRNIIKLIPASRYKATRRNKKIEIKIPTEEQINKMKERFGNDTDDYLSFKNRVILELLLGSGIRAEELIGLDMDDIEVEAGYPYISVLGKGYQDADEKAVVYITEKSRDFLKLFLEVRKEYAEKCGYDGKALFISKNGRRLSQSALSDIIRTASDNEVTPHMLRHYYGTQLYRVTQDIVLVQQQLRHESIETAVSYYVAINIEDRMEKIARMNQI